MISPDGEIVYVGKSKRVRSRLLSYFRCAFPEDKGARILREAQQRLARGGVGRIRQDAAALLDAYPICLDRMVDPVHRDRERPDREGARLQGGGARG